MKYRLSSLLLVILVAAALLAWWKDRTALRNEAIRADQEAAQIAEELYRLRLAQCYATPYGSFFPPGLKAVFTNSGDVIDITTPAGRDEMRTRLAGGDTNFRIQTSADRILEVGDIQYPNFNPLAGSMSMPMNPPPAVVGNSFGTTPQPR